MSSKNVADPAEKEVSVENIWLQKPWSALLDDIRNLWPQLNSPDFSLQNLDKFLNLNSQLHQENKAIDQ